MNVSEKLKSLSIDRSAAPASSGKVRYLLIGVGLVAIVAVAWALFGRGSPPANDQSKPPSVAAAPVGATTPARPRGGLVASGYVVARRSATVSVDITGRLTDVLFEEGAVVEKGQILARLDDDLARY